MDDICSRAVDTAILNNILLRLPTSSSSSSSSPVSVSHIPFALFPLPFSTHLYNHAFHLQPVLNTLVDAISKSPSFITTVLKETADVDTFTQKCLKILTHIHNEGITQPYRLGIHRSDYLIHVEPGRQPVLQQVELNTISSGFPSISTKVSEMHREMMKDDEYVKRVGEGVLAMSASLEGAWKVYNQPEAIVLFVVQSNEWNIYDQRLIEKGLLQYGIRCIRATLSDIAERATLDGPQRKLFIDGKEVAITYFRAGYCPNDYTDEKAWSARLIIERSFSIKCPNIGYHLAGSKKIQQVLAQPGLFLENADDIRMLRESFTGLYPLDDTPDGLVAYQNALSKPTKYVMKPQREGGGNNIYGDAIKTTLLTLSPEQRKAYILMDLIKSPTTKWVEVETISEVGVYGVWLSDDTTVKMNKAVGHLLRTKMEESEEGGVSVGYAVLNTPLLV
ncbi:glutathione synthetase [Chytridium lagenaria]|nr:glutathione synthetase [Chytridium lagenaria]